MCWCASLLHTALRLLLPPPPFFLLPLASFCRYMRINTPAGITAPTKGPTLPSSTRTCACVCVCVRERMCVCVCACVYVCAIACGLTPPSRTKSLSMPNKSLFQSSAMRCQCAPSTVTPWTSTAQTRSGSRSAASRSGRCCGGARLRACHLSTEDRWGGREREVEVEVEVERGRGRERG